MSGKKPEQAEPLKIKIARALDDNLHTRQWHNIVDWLIVTMILISTTEIFLSTFDLDPRLRRFLFWVDIVTLIFFTIEVCLRIWVAPVVNPKFKGWKGRLRYCFTFYGAIDILSTFPFYLQWIFPLPVMAFKALRTARVVRTFRIGRYTKSFNLLTDAIREKRHELIVSLQFLIVITVILSLILFFAEHEAQPDVYDNGFQSVAWSFAQYIGDPGQFADTPPVTLLGKIIACLIGIMGIAIVAVPAGILGAGFTEAIENRNKDEQILQNANRLRSAFQRKLDRPTGFQVVPPFFSVNALQAKLCMTMDNIVEAVNSENAPHFRLINTSSSIPVSKHVIDEIAVEHFIINRPYGCMIDRQSNITIISPSSVVDVGVGNWAFYLAAIGGFNYISREIGDRADYKSYLTQEDHDALPGLKEFLSDTRRLLSREDAWSFTIVAASGQLEPEYPTQIHFEIGGKTGDTEMGGEDLLLTDSVRYSTLFHNVSTAVKERLGYETDHQKYHVLNNPRKFFKFHKFKSNNVVIRIEWEKILWNPNRIALAEIIAREIWNSVLNTPMPDPDPILKKKDIGFNGY